jgi:hypothetical protein
LINKKSHIFLSFCFILCINIHAQPYIYKVKHPTNRYNETVINKINLTNCVSTQFLYDAGNIVHLESDPSQKWIFIQNRFQFEVLKCEDTTSRLAVFNGAEAIFKVIYSQSQNNFYVKWLPTNPDEGEKISIFNAETLAKIDSLPDLNYFDDNFFISPKGDKVFACTFDTLTLTQYLYTYSLHSHKIDRKSLLLLGQGSGYRTIDDEKSGKFLIGYSYPGQDNGHNKYIIYDPSTDYSTKPLSFPYRSQGYLSPDARYIVLEEVDIDTAETGGDAWEFRPGNIKVYDAGTSCLISELKLPPDGEILFFDYYPDILYYYLPETNKTRIIDLTTLK